MVTSPSLIFLSFIIEILKFDPKVCEVKETWGSFVTQFCIIWKIWYSFNMIYAKNVLQKGLEIIKL